VLVTCSDDGTVRLYDEQGFLNLKNMPQGEEIQLRRTERLEQNSQKKQKFFLSLTPDEYRPGSRNKKLESITMNPQGYLVAGTNFGDILIWKIDFLAF